MTNNEPTRLDRIEQSIFSLSMTMSELEKAMVRLAQSQERAWEAIGRLTQRQDELSDIVISLRASEERQNRVLDYLIRRDGERNS